MNGLQSRQMSTRAVIGFAFGSLASGLGVHAGCSSADSGDTLPENTGGGANGHVGGGITSGVGGPGATVTGSPIEPGSTGTVGGATETACETTASCTSPQICHPVSKICVPPGSTCAAQSDCTGGTYCDATSATCLPGLTGSPCETNQNCEGPATCSGGICGCSGLANEQELLGGALDIYFVFDRTASMGQDCDYVPDGTPEVDSKACFATYALPEYLTQVDPTTQDIRLAFQFMSLPDEACDGSAYSSPLVDLTQLPVTVEHEIIQAISGEQFEGGYGTEIEGALNGIADFTAARAVTGREMIGVLMTDGDPNGCEDDVSELAQIIADHRAATGVRTFIIGMEGATGENLEEMALAGGAAPHDDYCSPDVGNPCHHWNVGDGSGAAIADALQAIVQQAAPLGCEYDVVNLQPPAGETLDYGKVNVTLTEGAAVTTIGQVPDAASCPMDQPAWYYDNPASPSQLLLCSSACALASGAAQGARLDIVVGCQETVPIEDVF